MELIFSLLYLPCEIFSSSVPGCGCCALFVLETFVRCSRDGGVGLAMGESGIDGGDNARVLGDGYLC